VTFDPAADRELAQELAQEQALLDYANECLSAMQQRARDVREMGDRAVRDEDTVDAKVAQFHLQRREADLHQGSGPLCFGRIDTEDDERWYVGRRHVEDVDSKPVVVDWRAPVSAAFYRATALDPCGLEFRRRFIVEHQTITALLDEHLDDPDAPAAGGLPDPLLAELERSRTGQMRDIVATIAAEQDLIIRAPLSELLIVQGGPGTGKTAVGLHRAAFLLFEHRIELIEKRVLIVGPNPLFLRYIAEVLPSLGETAATQTTLDGLVAARFRLRAVDTDAVARLKGRAEMAAVIRAAVHARIKPLSDGLDLRTGLARVHLDADELGQLQKTALGGRLPANQAREVFRRLVLQEAWRRHGSRPGVDPGGEPQFTSGVRQDAGFKAAIDKMWPNLAPAAVVRGLYSSPKRLAEAADGLLDADDQALLRRRAAKKPNDEQWTLGDLALLDEAQYLITGIPATYGHVVVDEAQDLSPMALRMLARRTEKGSMTILGDLAQATTPQATGSWIDAVDVLTDQLVELSPASEAPVVTDAELTVGYRVPAAILDVANRLLPEAAPDVTPARSVRDGGDPPLVLSVAPDGVAGATVREVAALRDRTASVAVVGLGDQLDLLESALADAGIPADRVGGAGLPGHDAVALVTPAAVKGLEFDAVVVIEPAAIAQLDAGLRHLYVSMTRAVQHLGIVHAEPLPAALVV
jgi:DNA helicase IV